MPYVGSAADRLQEIVAAKQRDRAAKSLDVIATPAAGARIDQHVGMTAAQLVPVREVVHDVTDLGDALAVGLVVGSPGIERIHVEVLAVQIDALAVDEPIDMAGQPFEHRWLAQLEQSAAGAAVDPFGMRVAQPRVGGHSLRLEPDDGLDASRVGVVADGPQTIRKAFVFHLPRVRRAASRACSSNQPASIHQ
jgi:hypothetical protein